MYAHTYAHTHVSDSLTQRVTKNHVTMKCYGLGLGLDTFRMVALDANFRKLEESQVAATYSRCAHFYCALSLSTYLSIYLCLSWYMMKKSEWQLLVAGKSFQMPASHLSLLFTSALRQ